MYQLVLLIVTSLQGYVQEKAAMALEIAQKKVAELEDHMKDDLKYFHSKIEWYVNQQIEFEKQRAALEAEVSMLKSEKESLQNNATRLTIEVAELKLRDEQYAAMDLELVEKPCTCNNISKLEENYSSPSDVELQSECLDAQVFLTTIKQLELRVELLTEHI